MARKPTGNKNGRPIGFSGSATYDRVRIAMLYRETLATNPTIPKQRICEDVGNRLNVTPDKVRKSVTELNKWESNGCHFVKQSDGSYLIATNEDIKNIASKIDKGEDVTEGMVGMRKKRDGDVIFIQF